MADEYLTDEDKAFLGMGDVSPNEAYWRKKLAGQGTLKATPPRSSWRRFMDSIPEAMRRGPATLIADVLAPLVETGDGKTYGQRREEYSAREKQRRENYDFVDPADSVGDYATDIAGSIIGSVVSDPTNLITGPAKTIGGKILTAGGIGAAADAALQGGEMAADIRDEYDPIQGGINAVAGPVLIGGAHGVKKGIDKYKASRAIARGGDLDLDTAVGIGDKFGTVTSTIRTPERNKKVGGAKNSYHLKGQAIDIARGKGVSHKQIERAYRRAGYDIIESLDEGDHSHFAFRFGKSKGGDPNLRPGQPILEDFDFRPPEQRPDDLGEVELVRNELPSVEEMARVNEALAQADDSDVPLHPLQRDAGLRQPSARPYSDHGLPPEVLENAHKFSPEHLEDMARRSRQGDQIDYEHEVRYADNLEDMDPFWQRIRAKEGDPVADFAPPLDSSHEKFTPYVERPNDPANDLTRGEEDYLGRTPEEVARDDATWEASQGSHGFGEEHLTPAERQGMDASAVRPDVDPTVPAGLGKGSVATTPVNDLRAEVRPDGPPPRPPFPDEEGFPKPGEPGNRGGPKGGADEPVEQRLINDLKSLKPMTGEQRALYRAEHSRRASSLSNLQRGEATRENIAQQFGSQRGQLPRKAFQSIAENYTDADFVALANRINQSPRLLPFQKLNAHKALLNLLGTEGAKLPTPSEIKLLSEVYSEDFVRALLENRDFLSKVWQNTTSALNVPRAVMSSMDFSAPFRQGIGLVHKKEFWKAIPHMFKMWADTLKGGTKDKDWINSLKAHPRWGAAVEAKLGITDPHSHFLAEREEDFMTDWAERIPFGFGRLIKASNSAYSGFLNKLRWDTFNNLLDQREAMGDAVDSKTLKQIGKFINMATGRGDLGKNGNAAAPALSAMLFSPRLIASRLKTLASPVTYMAADPLVRKEAWKSLLAMSGYYMTLGGIAKYMLGMDVETDPRSPDFMKAKIGNTRYDFMAGYSQYIRLGAQLLTDQTITGKGVEKDLTSSTGYKDDTRRDVFIRFFLNKLAPVPSLVSDWMEGSDPTGEPFEWKRAVANRMLPMASQDIADAIEEWGPIGAAMGLPGLGGWSVQTYKPKQKKEKTVSDEDFLSGAVDDSSDASELSAEDKEFLGL